MPLMPKPFAVLQHLVDRAGQLVTQDQLLDGHLARYVRATGSIAALHPRNPPRARRSGRIAAVRADVPEARLSVHRRGDRRSSDHHIGHSDDAGTGPAAGTLVGRASALADLRRYLAQTLTGRRHVIFVVGEPGIGKTSLADAFQRAQRRAWTACPWRWRAGSRSRASAARSRTIRCSKRSVSSPAVRSARSSSTHWRHTRRPG